MTRNHEYNAKFDVFVIFGFGVRAEISGGLQFLFDKSQIFCTEIVFEITQSTLRIHKNLNF